LSQTEAAAGRATDQIGGNGIAAEAAIGTGITLAAGAAVLVGIDVDTAVAGGRTAGLSGGTAAIPAFFADALAG